MLRLLQHQHRPRDLCLRVNLEAYTHQPNDIRMASNLGMSQHDDFRNDGSEGDDLVGWVFEVSVEALEHVAELFVEEGLADGGLAAAGGGCFVPCYGKEVDLFVLRCGEEG